MADAVPSDERDDKARRPASPVPPGAGGGLRMTLLASLERAPPFLQSAALSCSPGAARATLPYLGIDPRGLDSRIGEGRVRRSRRQGKSSKLCSPECPEAGDHIR